MLRLLVSCLVQHSWSINLHACKIDVHLISLILLCVLSHLKFIWINFLSCALSYIWKKTLCWSDTVFFPSLPLWPDHTVWDFPCAIIYNDLLLGCDVSIGWHLSWMKKNVWEYCVIYWTSHLFEGIALMFCRQNKLPIIFLSICIILSPPPPSLAQYSLKVIIRF